MTEEAQKTSVLALEKDDARILFAHAEAYAHTAHKYANAGNLDLAESFAGASKTLLDIAGEANNEAWLNYYWARSSLLQYRRQFEESLSMSRKSLAIARRLFGTDSWSLIVAETNIGDILGDMGHKENACAIIADGIKKLKACDVGTAEHMLEWRDATVKEFEANLAKYSA